MDRKLRNILLLTLLFVLVLGSAALLYARLGGEGQLGLPGGSLPQQNPPQESDAQEGQDTQPLADAWDFTVYDADGNAVSLSDFRGTPVVLNFWASWCGPCRMEMPDFQQKFEQLQGEVQFLMVNLTDGIQETQQSAEAFLAESGYSFPVFYDTRLSAAGAYGVTGIPMTFFITADGKLAAYAASAINGATLQQGLDYILPQDAA